MDVNQKKITSKINNLKMKNKEISLISPRNNTNNNSNKIGLVININNQKSRTNRLCNSNDYLKNKKYNTNNKILNEITLSNLERENSLLKKEIEIVKSNLIISDKKELINKKTIQEIKRMNKQKENSNKNMTNLINEYKLREIDFLNRIKELENDSKKKEEELNNELSLYKLELISKNKIINELNNKIDELKDQILSLKKIINEKNRILLFLTKKNKSQKFIKSDSINNIFNAKTVVSSKSCGNILSKIIDFKNTTNKNSNNSINNIRHNSKTGIKEILLNDIGSKNKNENRHIKIIRKQSYLKKRIPNNNRQYKNKNDLDLLLLQKINRKINLLEQNNNTLRYHSKNLDQNFDINLNLSRIGKRNDFIIKDKDNLTENCNNSSKIQLSSGKKIENIERTLELNKFKNYSITLNDLEQHQNQIKTLKEIPKNQNISVCRTSGNKKTKPENMKGLYSKKNKLIERNNNFPNGNNNINPSFISDFSFQSSFPSYQK